MTVSLSSPSCTYLHTFWFAFPLCDWVTFASHSPAFSFISALTPESLHSTRLHCQCVRVSLFVCEQSCDCASHCSTICCTHQLTGRVSDPDTSDLRVLACFYTTRQPLLHRSCSASTSSLLAVIVSHSATGNGGLPPAQSLAFLAHVRHAADMQVSDARRQQMSHRAHDKKPRNRAKKSAEGANMKNHFSLCALNFLFISVCLGVFFIVLCNSQ